MSRTWWNCNGGGDGEKKKKEDILREEIEGGRKEEQEGSNYRVKREGYYCKLCPAVEILLSIFVHCRLQLMRAERENAMFPDEVDTPRDVPARVRFQKYVSSSYCMPVLTYSPTIV